MPFGSERWVVLVKAAAVTATTTYSDFVLPARFTAARLYLKSVNNAGTTPTLNVYVQQAHRGAQAAAAEQAEATGANVYHDFIAFAQHTTGTKEQIVGIVGSGNYINDRQDAALTAGTIRNGPLGGIWRIKAVLGGTTPSYDIDLVVELIP